jgi:hypothetical protein
MPVKDQGICCCCLRYMHHKVFALLWGSLEDVIVNPARFGDSTLHYTICTCSRNERISGRLLFLTLGWLNTAPVLCGLSSHINWEMFIWFFLSSECSSLSSFLFDENCEMQDPGIWIWLDCIQSWEPHYGIPLKCMEMLFVIWVEVIFIAVFARDF